MDRLGLATFIGSSSIGFWILVSVSQIYENYILQSAEGLSLYFILIWLAGDLCNFLGALWQGLLPTVTWLALYYTGCDIFMLGQFAYYRHMRAQHPDRFLRPAQATEETALLSTSNVNEAKAAAINKSRYKETAAFFIGTVFSLVLGIIGWAIEKKSRHGKDSSLPVEQWRDDAQIIGWISAILYLTSRIPQMFKNTKTKCKGLSLLFFFFALLGNLTYSASIIIPSLSARHLIINMSWLVGSIGTIFLDGIVLWQFAYYAKARTELEIL